MLCSNFGTWFSDATNNDRSAMSWYKVVTGDQKVSSWRDSLSLLLTEPCQGEQIKETEMGGSRDTMEEKKSTYKVSVGKPKGRGPSGRSWLKWEDNMKIIEIG